MYFKIFIMCIVFLNIPQAIYSYKSPPNVKKQLEIITTKIQEHVQSILQPLETLDDNRRAELKDFARVISDTYNDMAVKLQIQIEGFLERYATVPTDIEFGTMFNDPIVGTAHKEPSSRSGNHPTLPYMEDSEPLMPMVRARTTPTADEEDLYIPNDPSVPTLSPKSSEEIDSVNVVSFKTTPSNDHTQSHKTPHLPLYYDGGKQQYYSRDLVAAIEAKRAKTKAQQKITSTTKRLSSSEEERAREQHEEKKIQFKVIRSPETESEPETESLTTRRLQIQKLAGAFKRFQEQKYRKRTSSEEDRDKEDKEEKDEATDEPKATTVKENKTLALTSSEEEDLNRMSGKTQTTAELPANSSEESTTPKRRSTTKKRRSKKTTKSVSTRKVKRTTKRVRPLVKKVKKYRPSSRAPLSTTTPTSYDPYIMYPEDSAKEEED